MSGESSNWLEKVRRRPRKGAPLQSILPTLGCEQPPRNTLNFHSVLGLLQPCRSHQDTRYYCPGCSSRPETTHGRQSWGRDCWALQVGENQPGEKKVPTPPVTFCFLPALRCSTAALLLGGQAVGVGRPHFSIWSNRERESGEKQRDREKGDEEKHREEKERQR